MTGRGHSAAQGPRLPRHKASLSLMVDRHKANTVYICRFLLAEVNKFQAGPASVNMEAASWCKRCQIIISKALQLNASQPADPETDARASRTGQRWQRQAPC